MKVDLSEFTAAMNYYRDNLKKDAVKVVNKQAGNLAMMATVAAPTATKQGVMSFQGKGNGVVFFRYLTKLLKENGVTIRRNKRVTKAMRASGDKRKKTSILRTYKGTVGREITMYQFARIGKKILERRIATVGAMKAVFAYVAERFGVRLRKYGKKVTPGAIRVIPANPLRWKAYFNIPFKKPEVKPLTNSRKATPKESVQGKARMGRDALLISQSVVAADMVKYVKEALAKRAAQISARRVAA